MPDARFTYGPVYYHLICLSS